MAALGSEVTGAWLQVSGMAISFMLLLLLTVFLTALCSQCSRRSFELGDSEEDRNPSALIRVVKLEEVAKENPIIDEIQRDETEETIVPPWRSHLGTLQHQDVPAIGSTAATAAGSDSDSTAEPPPPAWRNHLGALPSSDPQSSAHIHQISSTRVDVPAPRTNEEPDEEGGRSQGRERRLHTRRQEADTGHAPPSASGGEAGVFTSTARQTVTEKGEMGGGRKEDQQQS